MRLLEVSFAMWRHKDALTSRVYLRGVTLEFLNLFETLFLILEFIRSYLYFSMIPMNLVFLRGEISRVMSFEFLSLEF